MSYIVNGIELDDLFDFDFPSLNEEECFEFLKALRKERLKRFPYDMVMLAEKEEEVPQEEV